MTEDQGPVWPPVPPDPSEPATPTEPFTPTEPDAPEPDAPAVVPAPTEPDAPTEVLGEGHEASGIDALFGESKFVEHAEGPAASENPFAKKPVEPVRRVEPVDAVRPVDPWGQATVDAAGPALADDDETTARAGRKNPKVVLLWVAGSLVAVLALVALFLVGTKLPTILGPAPGAAVTTSASPSPSASPTPTTAPLGPVAVGEHQWDDLLGGECLNPYVDQWEQKYTVVDCETAHPAQLVTRGTFATADGVIAYPGMEALQSQVNLLCTSPTVVDYAKANAYTDIQYQASFAVSEQEWNDGNHFYYCFLSRSAAGELTGTIAMPQVAPAPAPSETPAP